MLRRLPHRRAVPSPPLPQPTTVVAIAAFSLMPCLSVRLQRTATLAPLASRSVPALYAFARPLICPALRVHLALAQFTRPPTPIPGDQGVSSSGARRAPSQRGAAPRRPSCCLTSLFGYSGGGAWVATRGYLRDVNCGHSRFPHAARVPHSAQGRGVEGVFYFIRPSAPRPPLQDGLRPVRQPSR